MLKDVIDFIRSRTDLTRTDALREINFAWKEIWNSDDLPNSIFEISVAPIDNNARISLPYYVGEIRAVKQKTWGKERIHLNTPRPYYQDDSYFQSPYKWRILGTSPVLTSVVNTTTITLTFDQPVTAQVIVSLIGPNDRGAGVREQVTFEIGDTTHESVNRYSDFEAISKNTITDNDLRVLAADDSVLAIVPNNAFEAANTIVQITDDCFKICNFCRCFDILYKKPAPYLHYDETPVAYQEVLMAKTMEWIMLPKDGQEQKADLFAGKASAMLKGFHYNEQSVEKKLDVGRSHMETLYYGKL